MADFRETLCDDVARRALVIASVLNGIDFLEILPAAQTVIHVHFLKAPPPAGLAGNPAAFKVRGGVRVRDIKVVAVTAHGQHLDVQVDRAGDFSFYTLEIESPALDRPYSRCDFSFKAGCPSRFDCRPGHDCPPKLEPEPLVDYMAKDYASFRRALLDLAPTLVPAWRDRHEADLGIALIELFSYAGDHLSYHQDAVAQEEHLETARQRVSVRRHARLIDYRMHDGASARTFLHFEVSGAGTVPSGTPVVSRIDIPLGNAMPPHGPVLPSALLEKALDTADATFATGSGAGLHPALNEILIHTWGNRECCVPKGATTIDLVSDLTARLAPGDLLLLEEVRGSETGLEADADPRHRQVVRLREVGGTADPILGAVLTRVVWDEADALPFPLCVSARLTEGRRLGQFEPTVSVARGNLVLAHHGRRIETEIHEVHRQPPDARPIRRVQLRQGPLSFRIQEALGSSRPVSEMLETDPHQAHPQVAVDVSSAAGNLPGWEPLPHLLDSHSFDLHFAVETENDGRALLRFGDGDLGLALPEECTVTASYWAGIGTAGNVGGEALVHAVDDALLPFVDRVRNPLPAWGGTDPEPIERVKQLAPAAFHADPIRAVTEEDYARAAGKHPEVSKAVATFRWTGSWHTVFITVDRKDGQPVTPELEASLRAFLERRRLAGYDLEIDGPVYVPLDIEIAICVATGHFKGHVEEAVLEALTGRQGFFHPDNFTFGQPVYLSRLYAAVEAVEGVESAEVRIFQRWGKLPDGELARGFILMDRLEVARLDNDPSFPENGSLRITMLGGK